MTPDEKRSLIAEGAQIANNLYSFSGDFVPAELEKAAERLTDILSALFLEECE